MLLQLVTINTTPQLFSDCASFYKKQGYKGRLSKDDLIWIFKDGSDIRAAARLVKSSGCLVLRGVYVSNHSRGEGLGTRFLQELKKTGALENCYTFPFIHLEAFYASVGFSKVASPPNSLANLLQRYNRKKEQVLLMQMVGG